MRGYRLDHLSDGELLRALAALVAQDRTTTAALVAHIAEVDRRRLYLPAGYPSMYAYCVEELRLSEDAASKRIQAARAAQRFPALFDALTEGRLHLSGVVLLAPHLTPESADRLLGAAAGKRKSEIEQLLAERFPRTELLQLVQVLADSAPQPNPQHAPGHVETPELVRAAKAPLMPAPGAAPAPRSQVKPHAPQRFALHLVIDQRTYDRLRYAQQLLGHQVPAGDVAQVIGRALEALIGQLERRKFAATPQPRPGRRRALANPRSIPAPVRRAVWQRDQGQCTFVSQTGHRCPARTALEFDHVVPVAPGGRSTVDNVRLQCRCHNQYQAECTFGAGFMTAKREETRRVAAEAGARAAAEDQARDILACLTHLGFRAPEARRAAEFCQTLPVASLEERVRSALRFLCPKVRRDHMGTSPGPPA